MGKVSFKNLIPGYYYVIKEEEVPKGYQISKNAIVVYAEYIPQENQVVTMMTNGGKGAAVSENGQIKWLEHRIRLVIGRKKSDGTLLTGAKMMLVDDSSGNTLENWVSSSEEGHEVLQDDHLPCRTPRSIL